MRASIWMLIATAIALLPIESCAPVRQGSRVASVDNFTRQDGRPVTRNVCGTDDVALVSRKFADRIISTDPSHRETVLKTLVAVPDALQQPFFALGGRIEIRPDAVTLCEKVGLSAAERPFAAESSTRVESCWYQPKAGAAPVIVLPAHTGVIRHSLVRLFAFVELSFVVDRLERIKSRDAAVHLTAFAKERDRIADALLRDAQRVDAAGADRLRKLRTTAPKVYADAAVAEAIDSYYCSLKSNRILESVFYETNAAFAGLAKQLGPPRAFKDE